MKEYVRTIADYPVKGIQFRDITTLLQKILVGEVLLGLIKLSQLDKSKKLFRLKN